MRANILDICFCKFGAKMHDIPASDSFACPLRKGFLLKLTGRGWFYSGAWKSRYCVLDGSKFYFYEKEQSKGSEKSCGVLNLDYYDLCEENKSRDKKNPFMFVIGTSVKGLFDNRHQFATETMEEMESWVRSIQNAIAEARINRSKKGGRKKQDGRSPDLSYSSQDNIEGASTTCLVNATKDRARGPQGRRLPQRKSMMPQSRSEELSEDVRQRSISLSTPKSIERIDEEDTPQQTSENKWLSLSMEEMERGSDEAFETQRSSSAFDIHKHKDSPPQSEGGESMVKRMVRRGNLMGQHAALTKELELKLKAGMAPGARRPPSEGDDVSTKREEGGSMERLISKVDSTKEGLNALEDKVNLLMKTVETAHENNDKAKSQAGDILLQATVTLQEAERINAECKRALSDVNEARTEYQVLVRECEKTLARLKSDVEHPNNET